MAKITRAGHRSNLEYGGAGDWCYSDGQREREDDESCRALAGGPSEIGKSILLCDMVIG